METLLEKAKKVKLLKEKSAPKSREEVDLVVGYALREVTAKQLATVAGINVSNIHAYVSQCLICALREGWLIKNENINQSIR